MSQKNSTRLRIAAGTLLGSALTPLAAWAHPGHEASAHFMAGVLHPLSGLDHVLMIVAVSAWAAMMKPAERGIVAACLALFVAIGALVPGAPSGPGLEAAIALTVIGAGLLLAIGRRMPVAAAGVLAAVFALIHGFAHGTEGPAGAGFYVPGLALTTGLLALAVSFVAAKLQSRRGWLRATGLAGALSGAVALFG